MVGAEQKERSVKNLESFKSTVGSLLDSNQVLRQLVQSERFDHEVKIVMQRIASEGRAGLDRLLSQIQSPEDREKVLQEKATYEAVAVIFLFFSDNPNDLQTLEQYIGRAVDTVADSDEPVIVEEGEAETEEEAPPADAERPAVEEEGGEVPTSLGSAIAEGIRAADEQLKREEAEAAAPQQKESQPKNERQQLTEAISQAFVDSDISRDELRALILEVSGAEAIKYSVDKQFSSPEVFESYVDEMIEVIFKHRELKPDAVGYGIGKVLRALERRSGVKRTDIPVLKGIFYSEFFMKEFLQRYLDLKKSKGSTEAVMDEDAAQEPVKEPPKEVVAESEQVGGTETTIEEPEDAGGDEEVGGLSAAELANQLADGLEDEDSGQPEPAEPELKITDKDIEAAVASEVVMAPGEPESIKVELEDSEREPVTIDDFDALARSEKYEGKVFYKKLLNNAGLRKRVEGLLEKYANKALSRNEVQIAIVQLAIENESISMRVGTADLNNPELVDEFFDELLTEEAVVEDTTETTTSEPLIKGKVTRGALLGLLSGVANKIVPRGLRVWEAGPSSIDEMSPEEFRRWRNRGVPKDKQISLQEAEAFLAERKAKKSGVVAEAEVEPELTEESAEVADLGESEAETVDEPATVVVEGDGNGEELGGVENKSVLTDAELQENQELMMAVLTAQQAGDKVAEKAAAEAMAAHFAGKLLYADSAKAALYQEAIQVIRELLIEKE